MSVLQFPEHCFFCTKELGSEHCLFPYVLIKELTLPDDTVEKAIFLTKLHCFFQHESSSHTVAKQVTKPHLSVGLLATGRQPRVSSPQDTLIKVSFSSHFSLEFKIMQLPNKTVRQ